MPHTSTSSPQFAATRWSIVLAAADLHAGTSAHQAFAQLAQTYWYPLYAYLRRQGQSAAGAEDLTQSFFARLIEKHALGGVDPTRGRFRSFLLAALKNFVANEWDKSHTLKRGGACTTFSLDTAAAETRYTREPADTMTPERIYERRWALATLDQVFHRLRDIYSAKQQTDLFTALQPLLVGGSTGTYDQIARQLNMSEGAIKVAVHRLRRRYRDILREEIAQTVADPTLIDEELRHLIESLAE